MRRFAPSGTFLSPTPPTPPHPPFPWPRGPELCRGWRKGPRPPPSPAHQSLTPPRPVPALVQRCSLQSADQGAQPRAGQAGRHPLRRGRLRRRLSTRVPVFLTEDTATTGPCQELSLYFFNDITKNRHGGGGWRPRRSGSWPLTPAHSAVASPCPVSGRARCVLVPELWGTR